MREPTQLSGLPEVDGDDATSGELRREGDRIRGVCPFHPDEGRSLVIDPQRNTWLCREPVDMRKSINGLSILVEQGLARDPFGRGLFVFCNRGRDKIKVLYWERTGFVLWYKRLEKHRFAWSLPGDAEVVTLTGRELNWLLDGIDVFALRAHEEISFETVL